MLNEKAIWRLKHIVSLLQKTDCSFEDICNDFERRAVNESERERYKLTKRTFIRDKHKIKDIFSILICYDKTAKKYFIPKDTITTQSDNLLEAIDRLHVLSVANELSDFVELEKIRPRPMPISIHGFIHAIKSRLVIEITYQKYATNDFSFKFIEPYFLKQSKNRWYLIGKDIKYGDIKSFGLDRISGLDITKRKFTMPDLGEIKKRYNHSFGIYADPEKDPEEVILSFTPEKGVYIKSLPLHESQEILNDNDSELRIKLKVYTSIDFVMELLSHGSHVKVLQPASLIEILKADYKKSLAQYEE